MDNPIHDTENRHTARMSRRGVLRASAVGVAAGFVATTPASALAFPTMNRTREEAARTAGAIRPFRVAVPDKALVALRRRLADSTTSRLRARGHGQRRLLARFVP